MTQIPIENPSPEARIRALLEAQTTPDPFDDRVAHLRAFEAGESLMPWLRAELTKNCWSELPRERGLAKFTALALVARDIDEVAARDLLAELQAARRHHPIYLARLRSLVAFSTEDFVVSTVADLSLFVSKALQDPEATSEMVREWLESLPRQDLEQIRRIFVVDREDSDCWGFYVPVLSTVTLVWRGPREPTWWSKLLMKFVLFHEVGHHVDRDRRGRSLEDLEDEADAYAMRRFEALHPWSRFFDDWLPKFVKTSYGRSVRGRSVERGSPHPS